MDYRVKLKELRDQRASITDKIQNLSDYRILREEIREAQYAKIDNQGMSLFLKDFSTNELVQKITFCKSIKAQSHWYYIQVFLSYLKWDFAAGLKCSQDYIEFIQQNPSFFNNQQLLPFVSNFMYHGAITLNKSAFKMAKNQLAEISKDKTISAAYVHYIEYTRSLEYAHFNHDSAITKEYLTKTLYLLEDNIKEYEESQIQYLYMVVTRGAIDLRKYNQASRLVNKWNQRGVLPHRKVQAILFSLITHYKLGYLELLRSELIQLKKIETVYKRDTNLIRLYYSFFKAALKQPTTNTYIDKLQDGLKIIHESEIGYFKFISFNHYEWSLQL